MSMMETKKKTDLSDKVKHDAFVEPLQFEMLLSELFASFVNIQHSEFDDKINYALQRIVQVLKIDRCFLLQYRYDTKHYVITHSWVAEGIPNLNIIGVGTADVPWIYANYAVDQKIVQFNRLDDLPDEAEADKRFFLKLGAKSVLILPISENQLPIGAFFLDHVRFERTWTPEFVQPLKRIAEVLLNVLLKKRSEEKLQRAFLEIKQLKDQLESERNYLQEEIQLEHNFENIIGQSQSLQYALLKVEQVAQTDTTALILGETGTGKELLARAIHDKSRRKKRPLIKVNCASLSSNLIESELFGHEKGAFTGAQTKRKGRFELADGATLFLDEIGELSLEAQGKLLRVLQEGEFERMGSSHTIKVDVRIIAATNRNLAEEVETGRFRKDLWYRLNVFPITAPPLRQRIDDIPFIVNWLVKKFCKKIGKQIESISNSTMKSLEEYSWPGNVRELENVIERAVISASSNVLQLTEKLESNQTDQLSTGRIKIDPEMEPDYIVRALEDTKWQIEGQNGAAIVLGLTPSSLRRRMTKYGITRP
jgi:formate hydrogenlyase transcriptional activator